MFRRWGIASIGSVAIASVGVFLVTSSPSRAAVATSVVSAPYAAADHSVEQSCSGGVQRCVASSSADARNGAISVSALADSGLDGTVPGAVGSAASGQLSQVVNLGPATAATFTFHVHVTRVTSSSSDAGRADVHLWTVAQCDKCPTPYEQDAFPDHPGDLTLAVTLVRGADGGSMADLTLGGYADARVGCDDFCVIPRGAGRATGEFTLTGVEVKLWGLGTPATPVISRPVSGAIVTPSTYQTGCDPSCQSVNGEEISGTAEPGMLIKVSDGATLVGETQADGSGVWTIYTSMSAGRHRVLAEAAGPQGNAWSSRALFTVAA